MFDYVSAYICIMYMYVAIQHIDAIRVKHDEEGPPRSITDKNKIWQLVKLKYDIWLLVSFD